MSKKIGAKLGIMRRVGANLSAIMRYTIYKSTVAPMLDYCSSIMLGLNKANLDHLQKLQNQRMRIVLTHKNERNMFKTLKFMSVKERIEYNVCVLIFKIKNGMCRNI